MKIAIVDDSELCLEMMGKFLLSAGHEVLSMLVYANRPDTEKNFGDLKAWNPDLILLDHYLGNMVFTGKEFAQGCGFPEERLVGISSDPHNHQAYCGWRSRSNKTDLEVLLKEIACLEVRLKH